MASTKRKSWTWQYYSEDAHSKVRCVVCSKVLKFDSKNTSGMIHN